MYFKGQGENNGNLFKIFDRIGGVFNYTATYTVLADTDGDDVCDVHDRYPKAGDKAEPGLCGCGVSDVDSDGVGVADCDDACPADFDFDFDFDFDSDGDCDKDDLCPDDSDKVAPGVCGASDSNSDGDGVSDCDDSWPDDLYDGSDSDSVCDSEDLCADDGEKTAPGVCGCGLPDDDTSGDGVDICQLDNPDDANNNGVCDGDEIPDTPAGVSVDGEGCSGSQVIADTCPCDAPWKNHNRYVSCVSQASDQIVVDGLFTEEEADAATSSAARSRCGYKKR